MENEKKTTEMQIKDLLKEIVTPAMEEQQKITAELVKGIIAEAMAELKKPVGDNPLKAGTIEGGEDRLAMDPKGGFKCMSYFARDVALVEKSGGRSISPELEKWNKSIREKAAGTGMLLADNEFGGYIVPPQFSNDLMVAIEHMNEFVPLCTPMPMQSNLIEVPYVNGFDESGNTVFGGVQFKWTDEEGQYSETRPKLGKITMKLKKLTGLAYVTEEMLSDSPISMEAFLGRAFASALNFELNRVILGGTGAGQPLGVRNAPCLVSVSAEDGQAADTIVLQNVLKMRSRIFGLNNSVWVCNPDILPQLSTMALDVGTGGVAVWMPAGGASGKEYDTLYGRRIIWSDFASKLGDANDIMLIDFSQYLFARKASGMDMRFDSSIHLKFDWGQTAFRLMTRMDGQPWWASAYTPPVSTTATRSPIVGLASR